MAFCSEIEDASGFLEVTNTPEVFFDILPLDWQESIVPFWPCYEKTSQIFVWKKDEVVAGGGILFSSIAPDTIDHQKAQAFFNSGQLYIGFLWIDEGFRGRDLGSKWIEEVRKSHPGRFFWLTIDDYRLASFYQKNGFLLVDEFVSGDITEWAMTDASMAQRYQ